MASVRVVRSLDCVASPEALWPVLSDTDRMDRAAGLGKVTLRPLESGGAARYLAQTRINGFPVEYEERPFEFVENRYWRIRRVTRGGVLRSLEWRTGLEPLPNGGTHVTFDLTVEPRFAFMAPFARLTAWLNLSPFLKETRRVDALLGKSLPAPLSVPVARVDPSALDRGLKLLRQSVSSDEAALVTRLERLLREGSDIELNRLRPFELADEWGEDRNRVLDVFLGAVVAGLFELSWEMLCPSCQMGAGRIDALSEIEAGGHCQMCDLSYGVDLDRSVEAIFKPASNIRLVDEGPYCSGGPARIPHVLTQAILPGDGEVVLEVPPVPGRFRLFVRGGATASVEARPGAPSEITATVVAAPTTAVADTSASAAAAGPSATSAATENAPAPVGDRVEPTQITVAPGGRVRVVQAGQAERHVKLERIEWINRAATAHHLGMSPSFRRQFSGEVIKAGLILKVARVSLLFSDLTGSTALYTRAGDAYAFRLVQDHFDVLREVIEGERGAVVKTIGDAVMAVFPDDGAAVRAAVAMQRAWPKFQTRYERAAGVQLKIGVHGGPCYTVTANGILDYFGQTVNLCARLQSAADSGEVVMIESLADEAQAAGWLGDARIGARFSAVLKGIDTPLPSARISIPANS